MGLPEVTMNFKRRYFIATAKLMVTVVKLAHGMDWREVRTNDVRGLGNNLLQFLSGATV